VLNFRWKNWHSSNTEKKDGMGEYSIVPASSEEPPLIILIARFHSENGILTTIVSNISCHSFIH
jgi:hypothetical protein